MRKFGILLLVAMLSLTGCARQKEEDPVRVGICVPTEAVPYRQELTQALENAGCYVNLLDGKHSQFLQNKQVAQLVQAQYDLLIIEPVIHAATDKLLAGLEAAGIPAILLNAPEEARQSGQTVCRVTFSEEQAGMLQGQCILHTPDRGDLNGDGKVACAYLAGPEDLVNTAIHTNACLAALAEGSVSVELLAQVFGEPSPDRGQALTEGLLDRFEEEMEVLFCGNSQLALGALKALQAAGLSVNEDIYVVSIGQSPQLLEQLQKGAVTGTVVADYGAMAVQVTRAAQALLEGHRPQQAQAVYVLKEVN